MGQKWLAEVSVNLKESSIVKYEDLLRCYIYPSLGTTDLSDITNEQMMNFATDLKKNGGKSAQGLSGSTVSEVISVIAGLRGYALRHGYSVVFTTDCVSIRQQRNDIRVFSIEEEERLVSWLLSHKDSDAVPDDMIASRFNSIVEDVASITNETGETQKNLMDLLLYYFSKEIRMPIDKLTSDEKDMLMSIFERSGRYKAELRNMTKGRRKKR